MSQPTEKDVKLPSKAVFVIIGAIVCLCSHNVKTSMASTILYNADITLGGSNTFAICVSLCSLIECALIPFVAKLNSIYKTRKKLITIGAAIYAFELLVMAIIPSMVVVQWTYFATGISGACITGTAYTVISETAGPQAAGKWLGIYGTSNSVAKLLPVIMGITIDLTSYRSSLIILFALFAAGSIMLMLNCPKPTEEQQRQNIKIDFPAALSFSLALAALLCIFTFANSIFPWGTPGNIMLIIAAAIMICVTVYYEKKRGIDAPIPTPVFKNRNMVLLFIIAIAYTGIVICASVFLPIYMQSVMQTTAFQATVPTLLYAPLGIFLAVPISTYIGKTRSGKSWLLGLSAFAIIYAAAMLLILKPTANIFVIYGICLVYGLLPAGSASVIPTAMHRMVPHELAVYAGPLYTIGAAFGASLGSAIYLGYYLKMGAESGMRYGYTTLAVFAGIVLVLSLFLRKPDDEPSES